MIEAYGFVVGLLIGGAIKNRLYQTYLIDKANPMYRTAICIRRKFYYIIPESEYVNLRGTRKRERNAEV